MGDCHKYHGPEDSMVKGAALLKALFRLEMVGARGVVALTVQEKRNIWNRCD
jgi:hypothetical protein